ncbi:MAG: quinone-dependent dihydroorotate dehydrogenase [Legionella sp.]|nr:quinone-dependent dihydroorotate dehydrogenase [Legionella sp.]
MYALTRPLLFSLDAEKAHKLTLEALHWLPSSLFKVPKTTTTISAMGINFPHAIGLAAGLDKNGEHLDALSKLGFSFIELGTVTPRAQAGNPLPRLFRLPEAGAIINRMGFNNAGVEALVANVRKANYRGVLGINIGKNKDTSLNNAADDYLFCLKKVYEQASYVTINISSPNTPDLRQLQQDGYLPNLLQQLSDEQKRLQDRYQRQVPLVVKFSPDEEDEALKKMAESVLKTNIAGIIATNTTCSRDGVQGLQNSDETGGLSGKPLFQRSTRCLSVLKEIVGEAVTLIGVGGIDDVQTATQKLQAGASLLQVYTGLIYQGPGLVTKLAEALSKKSNVARISEA